MQYIAFIAPHFPLIAPQRFWDVYDTETIDLPVIPPGHLAALPPAMHRMRAAFGLGTNYKNVPVKASPTAPINVAANRASLDNVRLWDWQAFHDTVTQIQPLRPYTYVDTDIDRYRIDGKPEFALGTQDDPGELLAVAARFVSEELGTPLVTVYEVLPGSGDLIRRAEHGWRDRRVDCDRDADLSTNSAGERVNDQGTKLGL